MLAVYVTPRAAPSLMAGKREGAIWFELAVAPMEGAANEAVVELLARCLDLPRRAIRIVSGHTSRRKRIAVEGITLPGARRR